MLNKETIQTAFNDFQNKKILVVGDVMMDAYLWGKVERISPEAPVPIVSVTNRENRLGGAANVAINIKSMGAEPILCSAIGNDQKADEFINLLEDNNITSKGIFKSNDRITTTKFRVIGNNYQMLRVDEEITAELTDNDKNDLYSIISENIKKNKIDALIFQDYNKGVLTSGLIRKIIALANNKEITIIADPKKKNFDAYQNITLLKPNLKELKDGLNLEFNAGNIQELSNAVEVLHKKQNIRIVLATLSEKGIFVSNYLNNNEYTQELIPAHFRSISDVSGAGDTVVSVAALFHTTDFEPVDIAKISNLAGGIVCEEVGVVPIDKNRLFNEAIKVFI